MLPLTGQPFVESPTLPCSWPSRKVLRPSAVISFFPAVRTALAAEAFCGEIIRKMGKMMKIRTFEEIRNFEQACLENAVKGQSAIVGLFNRFKNMLDSIDYVVSILSA